MVGETVIKSNKPFDLIMIGWTTIEEADKFKANNLESDNTYFTYDLGPRDHGQA